MSGLQFNSITGPGSAAAASVASALAPDPKKHLTETQLNALQSSGVRAHAATATGGTTASTSATTAAAQAAAGNITSNDFLTLLVSELKNQDPTQPTDPNAYITQLVGVNSLQQLISINKGVTSLDTPPATSTTTP